MAILSICPKCQASIQLSEESSDPTDEIRCPKCKKTFLLHEALDIMAESPPEAAPVKKKAVVEAKLGPPSGGKNLGPAAAGAPVPPMTPAPQAAYDEEDDRTVEAESTSRSISRKRSREPSMMGTMIGVVIGGAMGIYMGAYVLNYLGIPLPGPVQNLPGLAAAPKAEKAAEEKKTRPVAKVEPEPPPKVEAPPTKPEPTVPEKTAPVEPVIPKKAAPPTPEIGVKDAPTFTPGQLGTTLGEANKASGGQTGKSSGPAFLDPAVYSKLCELAERATYVRADLGDKTIDDRKRATGDVIKRIVGNQENVVKMGQYGAQKLAESTPAERGVALCGVVASIAQRGKLVAVELTLYGGGKRATVMCPIRGNMKVGDKVVILGTIEIGRAHV